MQESKYMEDAIAAAAQNLNFIAVTKRIVQRFANVL